MSSWGPDPFGRWNLTGRRQFDRPGQPTRIRPDVPRAARTAPALRGLGRDRAGLAHRAVQRDQAPDREPPPGPDRGALDLVGAGGAQRPLPARLTHHRMATVAVAVADAETTGSVATLGLPVESALRSWVAWTRRIAATSPVNDWILARPKETDIVARRTPRRSATSDWRRPPSSARRATAR